MGSGQEVRSRATRPARGNDTAHEEQDDRQHHLAPAPALA
jgi:hypothetical protein